VLVQVAGSAPFPWRGEVVDATEAGILCTQRPDCVSVWAPGPAWRYAFHLLAMFKSAAPERCLVLTDVDLPAELVPWDTWAAEVTGSCWKPPRRGFAAYACADLRSDRIFRLLLSGRVRRRPDLRPLLDGHAMLATAYGGRLLQPWERVIPVLFGGGLEHMMDGSLRAALEELADASRDAEHAVTGGFHTLDELVRGPADWEGGARRYLPLAAGRSPEALAVVQRWLASTGAWERASAPHARAYRVTAATALHRLADDPWLPGDRLADLLTTSMAA
jgi:hypothetical protein